jgi:hypothetical protein
LISTEQIKKKTVFRIFLIAIIVFTCLNIYVVLSGVTHDFNWNEERLTATIEGFIVQIVVLIALLGVIALFIHILIIIVLYLKGSDDSV